MRKALPIALAVLLLAGCGGKKTTPADVAAAIEGKDVASLYKPATGLAGVHAVSCIAAAISGNYDCTGRPLYVACRTNAGPAVPCDSTTAPTKAWVGCYPNPAKTPALACTLENPPAGLDVFVTAAQRAAAKVATWKCVNVDYQDNPIGPLTISIAKTFGPVETEPDALTKAKARALAKSLHLTLRVHCG